MPKDRKESTFFAVFWLVGPAGFEPAECGSQSPCENAYIWLYNATFSAALVPCWYLKNAYNNLKTILSPFHYVLYRQKKHCYGMDRSIIYYCSYYVVSISHDGHIRPVYFCDSNTLKFCHTPVF